MLFDVHTHQNYSTADSVSVKNVIVGKDSIHNSKQLFTAGIHPWFIDDLSQQIADLESFTAQKNCLAIGEIGLDKLSQTNFELQIKAFEACLKLAQEKDLPIVIHCVKAQNEILQILKKCNFKGKVLIHGFNQNASILSQWLKANCYISLGAALLNPQSNAHQLINAIPQEKLLLETDDTAIEIKTGYEMAASLLKISNNDLEKTIAQNFKSFYSKFTF